jgi:hypothetical protein
MAFRFTPSLVLSVGVAASPNGHRIGFLLLRDVARRSVQLDLTMRCSVRRLSSRRLQLGQAARRLRTAADRGR